MSLAIANRYARALVDVILEPNSGVEPTAALDQVRTFAALVADSTDLRNILLSPAVQMSNKREVAAKLGEKLNVSQIVKNFLYVVISHRRVGDLPGIAKALESALDERLGRVRAEVTSATLLNDLQRAELVAELAKSTGKQVRGDFQVDPQLLGGVSVRIGSKTYDGSVRGRLDVLRRRLA
jgi:F-type H+-transporting ATPase subunit delta